MTKPYSCEECLRLHGAEEVCRFEEKECPHYKYAISLISIDSDTKRNKP